MQKDWLQQAIEKMDEYDKGYDNGKKETAIHILGKLMNLYIGRQDLNDKGYGHDEGITMNDLLDLAEEYEVKI